MLERFSRRHFRFRAYIALGVVVSLAVWPGCGGGSNGLLGLFLNEEELAAYEAELAAFNEHVEGLPQVAVRIVNQTNAAAYVNLSSAVEAPNPESAVFDEIGAFAGDPLPYLQEIDGGSLVVAAGGTVTGRIKCGEVIAVSAEAPIGESVGIISSGFEALYISNGNIVFTGAGVQTDEESAFTGDLLYGARYITPAEDIPDCASSELLIVITRAATRMVFDETTGEVIAGGAPGEGEVSIQPAP